MPYGITLREIIFGIGGGIPKDKKFKAVQTGGPSGGVIPAQHLDERVDYESLQKLGSIMGSGGMVVMDEDSAWWTWRGFSWNFAATSPAANARPAALAPARCSIFWTGFAPAKPRPADLEKLEALATVVRDASLCGLGQTAPNPVLTTLRYFRDEYLAHVVEKRCPARVCRELLSSASRGDVRRLSLCARGCPVHTIFKRTGKNITLWKTPAFIAARL